MIKTMKLPKIFNQKGIGLVEVIAALGIAVVVITSLVSLALFTLRSSLRSTLFLDGTKMANRELELIRKYRDSSTWTSFTVAVAGCTSSSPCSINATTGAPQATATVERAGTPNQITRRFWVTNSSGTIRVTVDTFWTIGTETKHTYLYTDYTNWRSR